MSLVRDKSKPGLCIDIDNVIAKTDEVVRQAIHDFTGGGVRLSYSDIIEFDYYKCTDSNGSTLTREQWDRAHELFSEPRYLWAVQPVQGVQSHLSKLHHTFDIHLATSRLPKARRTTTEWLENHNFPAHSLHFLKHGEKHVSLGKFFAAVEDHYDQAVAFANFGTRCFLLEHPWNRARPPVADVYWVRDWSDLTEQLLGLFRQRTNLA